MPTLRMAGKPTLTRNPVWPKQVPPTVQISGRKWASFSPVNRSVYLNSEPEVGRTGLPENHKPLFHGGDQRGIPGQGSD
jgi:hypothetical protein